MKTKRDEKTTVAHKTLTVIGAILCAILIPILAINVTLIVKSYTNAEEVPSIGGVFPLIVLTDSMQPEIDGGDLIICHTVEPKDVKDGDIIAFFDPAGNGTSIVTHRVVDVTKEDGDIAFKTKGDANNAEDRMLVGADDLVGVYQGRIKGAGNIAMFMQSTTGLIICVVLPIILLIGYDVIRRRSYEKKSAVDNAALLAELEALRAEKAQKDK
ncbi:MAG: signal peptidase I [Firmicutes bacterium]|nr:signal peptidase I [Bacillota bacterium]